MSWDLWPGTPRRSKEIIFRVHLEPELGHLRLNEINAERVQKLRAKLVGEKELGDKRINNEYRRILKAAKSEGPFWYAAACLAVRALRWREDVDMVAKTITVNTQLGNGHDETDKATVQVTTTPKGRTRRTIPMTSTLYDALKALDVVREGYVVRNEDGWPMSDARTSHMTYRICRKAGLPERGWHQLRHACGTHCARFGVNPWQLMEWMGHKRIDETTGYVHVIERMPARSRPSSWKSG